MILIKSVLSLNKEIKIDFSIYKNDLFIQIPFIALSIEIEKRGSND